MTRTQLKLINATLQNNDTDTDEQIIQHFKQNGIDEQVARYAVTFRSMFLTEFSFQLCASDFPVVYQPIR